MKKFSVVTVILVVFALSLGGCAGMTPSQQNGALFGGAIGAGIPLIMGEPTGVIAGAALIGGAAGAVLGELFSPQQQYQQYPYSSAPSGLEAIEAQAYAKEKQKILRKRQRAAEKAAKEAGIAAAQAEMAEE